MKRKLIIGNSPISKTIYAGHLNKTGKMWLDGKQDVTIQVLVATVEHCLKWGDQVLTNSQTGEHEFEIIVKDLRKPTNEQVDK